MITGVMKDTKCFFFNTFIIVITLFAWDEGQSSLRKSFEELRRSVNDFLNKIVPRFFPSSFNGLLSIYDAVGRHLKSS